MQELTARQLLEWQIYDQYEPISEHRADIRMGYLLSLLEFLAEKIHSATPESAKFREPAEHFPWLREDSERFAKPVKDEDKVEDLPFEERAALVREMVRTAFRKGQ